jgi:PadR family transcriptional regulator, regulatory protein AphA
MTNPSKFASELSPKYVVLGFLYFQPMHGYDLHKQIEIDLREVWRIRQSQSYNLLKHLEKEGWITTTHQPQEKRPDRELLTITDSGRNQFESWLFTPTPGSARAIRVEFITRLYFASQISENLCSRLTQEQAKTIRMDLILLFQRLAEIPADQVFNRLGLELRTRQLTVVLEWIEDSLSHFVEGSS